MRHLMTAAVLVCMFGCAPEAPPPAEAPRSDKELILDAILDDVLNNPDFKDIRDSYRTPGDRQIALVSNPEYGVPWPEGYRPTIAEYTVVRVSEGELSGEDKPGLLGVRIDKFDLQHKRSGLFNTPIVITILNAGGSRDGAEFGGCSIFYNPKREGNKWTVEFEALRGQ